MKKKAIVLTSGGLDSTTCLAIAKHEGFECYTVAFDYGQKHAIELRAAARISLLLGAVQHKVLHLPIGELRGSALTDSELTIPDYIESSNIPITYVPNRNMIFLSLAVAYAEVIGARDIFTGLSAIDYSHYPDARPEFVEQMQKVINLATKSGIEGNSFTLRTPLLTLSKAQTIQLGHSLGVDYSQTITCYQATEDGKACGRCDACTFRKKGFRESGLTDPTPYVQTNHGN